MFVTLDMQQERMFDITFIDNVFVLLLVTIVNK